MQDQNPNTIASLPKRKYHLHIDLEEEYAPMQKKNKNNTLTSVDKETARLAGKRHIDIWSDGKIYPIDPTTISPPNFTNVSSLLRFAGDGNFGLLGYCHHLTENSEKLANMNKSLLVHNAYLLEQQNVYIDKLKSANGTIANLERDIKTARLKNTTLGLRQRCKSVSNIETLRIGGGGLKKRIRAVRYVFIIILVKFFFFFLNIVLYNTIAINFLLQGYYAPKQGEC